MTMGERIRTLRKKHGYTQTELGDILGVQKASINKYENGTIANIPTNTLVKLAKAFGVTIDYIVFGTDATTLPELYNILSESGKEKLTEYALLLLNSGF